MARTTKRQPLSVSTASASYSAVQSFVQAEFKGLSDVKNDVIVDQMSFSRAENIYVDDNMLLTSRPPFKRSTRLEENIIQESVSGGRRFTLAKGLDTKCILTCGGHMCEFDHNPEKKLFFAQVKEKTFIWTPTGNLIVFASSSGFKTGEVAKESFYTPIATLVVNGVETELESKNILTPSYKVRHQESMLSHADRGRLLGKSVDVLKNDETLYTIDSWTDKQQIVYPTGADITGYNVEVRSTVEGDIYMRYNAIKADLGVSFDGIYYQNIPLPKAIIGEPFLSNDGTCIFVIVAEGIMRCKLFASDLDEVEYDYLRSWELTDQFTYIDTTVIPRGDFLAERQYVLIYKGVATNPTVYIRNGDNTTNRADSLIPDYNIAVKMAYQSGIIGLMVVGTNIKGSKGQVGLLSITWGAASNLYTSQIYAPYSDKKDAQGNTITVSVPDALMATVRGTPYDWGVTYYEKGGTTNTKRLFCAFPVANVGYNGVTYNTLIIEFLVNPGNTLLLGPYSGAYCFLANRPAPTQYRLRFSQDGSLLAGVKFVADVPLYNTADESLEVLSVRDNGVPASKSHEVVSVLDRDIFYSVSETTTQKMWTSKLYDTILYLDETVTASNTYTDLGRPTHYCESDTYYFSFSTTARNLLTTSLHKTTKEGETLLYLPERNTQIFSEPITNIQKIADDTVAVFTNDGIWNVSSVTLDDGSIAYTAPSKSKLPIGCREGDATMVMSDAQAILVPTPRGLAALAPKDFVATSENVINYLTDNIQSLYYAFYTTRPDINGRTYDIAVKMVMYRYWIFLYKHMSRELLVLDTRTMVWWKWSTPYPVMSMNAQYTELQILMYVGTNSEDYNRFGVPFILEDDYDDSMTYSDDVIDETYNGDYKSVSGRIIKTPASPVIEWYFTSQKLHFNQLNNYKAIKSMTVVLEGEDTMNAKLSTKIYRSLNHPEKEDAVQIPINELRTFTHRLNLWHTINFQYTFENDPEIDEEKPLRLGSITIKYEVKEGIR